METMTKHNAKVQDLFFRSSPLERSLTSGIFGVLARHSDFCGTERFGEKGPFDNH